MEKFYKIRNAEKEKILNISERYTVGFMGCNSSVLNYKPNVSSSISGEIDKIFRHSLKPNTANHLVR